MLLRSVQIIKRPITATPINRVICIPNPHYKVKPIQIVFKRNASIHTRNILIQKFRLEHVNNFGVLLLLFPVATFGLGIWQVKRKIWKERLIAELKHKTNKEPIDLPDDLEQLNNMEYEAVRVRGQFLHDKELYLGPRTLVETEETRKKGGLLTVAPKSGYLVITPFQLEGREELILVNRGWVPKTKRNLISRKEGQIDGFTQITGVVRKHEGRPQFMPKMNDDKLFLYRDVKRMSNIVGTEPYYLDATAHSNIPGGPLGGQTTITLRNEHLSYVCTWFSLSGLTAYFWYKLIYLVPK